MEEALQVYEEALALARELGDRSSEGAILGNLGLLQHDRGRMTEAREHYQQALASAREGSHRQFEGRCSRCPAAGITPTPN